MARQIWRVLFLLTLGSFFLLFFVEWNSPGTPIESVPLQGGDYHAALVSEPLSLDPARATDSISGWCVIQMFDGLVRFQSNQEDSVAPSIATSWDISADHKIYTFHLRENVRFHDWVVQEPSEKHAATQNHGRVVTSEDFRFSFERVLRKETASPRSVIFEVIEGARAFVNGTADHVLGIITPNPRTLVIRLEKPYKPFLKTLTMPAAFVVPKEDVETRKGPFPVGPAGTGAFRFGGYRGERGQPGRELRLIANDDYFRGRPYINQVVFHIEPNEQKVFKMFLAGELHHSTIPDPDYDTLVEKNLQGFERTPEVSRLGVYYYGMNVERPPFDNILVRQAFACAVDREAIKKYIKIDRVDVADGPLPPSLHRGPSVVDGSGSGESLPVLFNLTRAGKLLDEAGYTTDAATGLRPGFPQLTLDISESEENERIARAVQANFADLGVVSRVRSRSMPEHLELVRRGESSIFRLGWIADYEDADSFLYYCFHSRNIGKSNYSRYANPKVDRLLDDARETMNQAARDEMYRRVEEILMREAPWICFYYLKTELLRQRIVNNLNLSTLGEHMISLDKVWFSLPRAVK